MDRVAAQQRDSSAAFQAAWTDRLSVEADTPLRRADQQNPHHRRFPTQGCQIPQCVGNSCNFCNDLFQTCLFSPIEITTGIYGVDIKFIGENRCTCPLGAGPSALLPSERPSSLSSLAFPPFAPILAFHSFAGLLVRPRMPFGVTIGAPVPNRHGRPCAAENAVACSCWPLVHARQWLCALRRITASLVVRAYYRPWRNGGSLLSPSTHCPRTLWKPERKASAIAWCFLGLTVRACDGCSLGGRFIGPEFGWQSNFPCGCSCLA